VLGHEVGEEEAALPPRKSPLVDHHAFGFDGDPAREEDLQESLLLDSCRDFASILSRISSLGGMNNTLVIRVSATAVALALAVLVNAAAAGHLRAALETAGTPIGAYDLLIAAQALRSGTMLVTANVSEFARVRSLVWQDWTADAP